jgi:hypothetical protein
MKGAASLPVPPGFEQPRLPPDQTGQGRAGAKLIKETGGQGHGEGVGYTWTVDRTGSDDVAATPCGSSPTKLRKSTLSRGEHVTKAYTNRNLNVEKITA